MAFFLNLLVYLQSVFANGKSLYGSWISYDKLTPLCLLNGMKYLFSVSMYHYFVPGESNSLCHSRICRKYTYSHICFCSMNLLCFYLWWAYQAGNEVFGCFVRPYNGGKWVIRTEVLLGHIMVYLPIANAIDRCSENCSIIDKLHKKARP
jgi:hypothetical protein